MFFNCKGFGSRQLTSLNALDRLTYNVASVFGAEAVTNFLHNFIIRYQLT